MAVNDANLDLLRVSRQFTGRVRMAIINYAVYLDNNGTGGALGNWSKQILTGTAATDTWLGLMIPYVLINVAAASTVTGSGDTLDIEATDATIRSQVEVQVQARNGQL